LNNDPGLVNREPYTTAWMIRVKPSSTSDKLLELPAYLKAIGQ